MMIDLRQEKANRTALATNQQRQASDPQMSVWVEASAGTGKTKVLSDRVLRLLLNDVTPGRILCLTYTKAAAVEMNNRIAGRLSKWAVISDEDLQKELEKLLGFSLDKSKQAAYLTAQARKLFALLLDTPGGMKIQTIHSFCQEILKRFPLEAKISPYFEVMDDRMAAEGLEEVKKNLLQKIETEPESKAAQALSFITKRMSEFTFPKLMNTLTESRSKIGRLLEKYVSVDVLVAETAERLGVAEDETEAEAKKRFFAECPKGALQELAPVLATGSETDRKKVVILESILNSSHPEDFYDDYRSLFFTTGGEPRKTLATKNVMAQCLQAEEMFGAEQERIGAFDDYLAAVNLFASTRAVLYLADDLIKGYNAYKALHSKMDYEDLIVITRQLLENPQVADWVLYKLDGGIDNVLIDEAQDTSPDQWAIIRALTNEFFDGVGAKDKNCTVFAVGDRKQSIYSFQGADPQEFDNMRRHFAAKLTPQNNFSEVNLEVSFRSTAAILDTVNCVFEDETAKKGVAPVGQEVAHIPSRIGEGGRVELWPLIEAEENENPDIWLPPVERVTAESTSSRLARQIALRIKKMVSGGEILVSQNRPLRFSDFMLLVQRRNGFVEEFVRACKNCGVEVAGVDKIKLLEQIAVQDLVSLGKFLLLPTDDLTLAEVLKSPLFGLNDDDLFALCYNRGKASLWSRLGDNAQYADVYSGLKTLLNMADFVRPFELYSYVLNKSNGRKKFVARLGLEAEDGLDEFMNLCLSFEQEHIPSLQLFIDWIEQDEVEIKRELEQSDIDAVRIMTVHGSKGLQAPVVILPDTVRVKSIRNEAGILFDDLMYYPLCSADYEKNSKAVKQKEKELSLEEYRRLLYVALTRAEDRLCICGYKQSTNPSEESWYEICRRSLIKIAEQKEDGTLLYDVKQVAEPPLAKDTVSKVQSFEMPDWAVKEAPEESALSKPYAPSKADEEDNELSLSPLVGNQNGRFRRGLLIHKLLQFLPQNGNVSDKKELIRKFILHNAADVSRYELERVTEEVLGLMNDARFASLFSGQSRAEVPIMGRVGDRIISGQIDRLVVDGDCVKIIDYKTNRPAAQTAKDIPLLYRKQLSAYRELVEKLYPDKRVETYILWTDTANLMLVE